MSVLFLTHFIPIQIYSVEFMLKVTIQKQVLKVLQITDWITLRLDHVNQTKYLSIIELLPDTFNSSMGYHSYCYKNL